MIRKDYACCFTGHRIIAKSFLDTLPHRLESIIRTLVGEGITDFISGGALGFDTLAAEAVLRLRDEFPQLRLIMALPCRDQAKGWSIPDLQRYQSICQAADVVHYTGDRYTAGCMMRRNRFMVDNSVACIFYLTRQRSGTCNTVSYAIEQNLKLYNILSVK